MEEPNLNPPEPIMEAGATKIGKQKKLIITVLIIGGIVILAIILYFFFKPAPVPLEEPGRPIGAPALSPKIETIDELDQYTGGKPMPPVIISGENEDGIVVNFTALVEHVRGNPLTPITLIEYADLGSPYASIIHPYLKEFVEKNKEKVHWAFRHFPDSDDYFINQASECVFLQLDDRKFWEFVDQLFQQKNPTRPILTTMAVGLGVNVEEFNECLDSDRTYNYILLDKQDAVIHEGIHVTPSFIFLNNNTGEVRILDGINTMDYMQAVLDAMLAL